MKNNFEDWIKIALWLYRFEKRLYSLYISRISYTVKCVWYSWTDFQQ